MPGLGHRLAGLGEDRNFVGDACADPVPFDLEFEPDLKVEPEAF